MGTLPDPTLSVVIAVWNDTSGVADCLRAMFQQADGATEIVVVANLDPPAALNEELARVPWLREPDAALIPRLWSRGIADSRGRVVALTTSHFTPEPGWLHAVRTAHERSNAAGIGGRIEPPMAGSAVAWATFFLRYSNYFGWHDERSVSDIAGDNASYKRDAMLAHWAAIAGGFWEPDFHRRILAEGRELRFVPDIRMRQHASYGFRSFCRQRKQHGRHFGAERIRGQSDAVRLLRIASSPLIPVVFLGKIAWRVTRSGRDFGQFARSLPVLTAFVLAWVAGEVSGYWDGGRAESRSAA